MKFHMSKVTTKGQVTIPEEIRNQNNINPGDSVIFLPQMDEEGTLRFKVVKNKSLADLAGSLHDPDRKYVPLAKVRKQIAAKQKDETWI